MARRASPSSPYQRFYGQKRLERVSERPAGAGAAFGEQARLVAAARGDREACAGVERELTEQAHTELVGVRHVRDLDDGRERDARRGRYIHPAPEAGAERADALQADR